MTLVRRDSPNQTYIDDSTGLLHLVAVANDGTVTDVVAYAGNGRLDGVTEAAVTIDTPHHEIHEARHFLCADVQNINTTTVKWMVTTPNSTRHSHMVFDIHCTGEQSVVITAGADRTGTNLLTCINRNQVGTPNAAGTVIHRAVSGGNTDGVTPIDKLRIGITGQGSKTIEGGATHTTGEFILNPNTKYIVAVETFADVYVTFHPGWYEYISLA